MVDILLNKGADICSKDFNGNTPLHLAAQNGDVLLIESLLTRQPHVAYEQNHVK